jgi:chaperonin GroEL
MDERPAKYVHGKEAEESILSAVSKVATIVKKTLGPSGRNALVDRGYRAPRITNDGIFIAKSLEFGDPIENVIARQLVEVAERTNDEAGDGTTTAITLAEALIKEGFERVGGGTLVSSQASVIALMKEIRESKDAVIAQLEASAVPAKDVEVLKQVAATSLEDDLLSQVIAEMVEHMGEEGHISVVEGFHGEVETEIIEGMQFDGKLAHEFLANANKKAEYEDPSIVLTNHHIESPKDIAHFVQPHFQSGKKEIVIMAPKFSMDVLMEIAQAKKKGFIILAVKIPALTNEQIDDVSAYTDAIFYDKEKGSKLGDVKPEGFGNCAKIEVDDDKVVLLGGNKEAARKRIKELEDFIKIEKDELFRKKYEMRIASLASSVGIIKVGQATEAEKGYLKLKIEDAVFATRAAYLYGVIKGGGVALKEIAEELEEGNILKSVLTAPYEMIQENAGGNLEVGEDVLDPLAVTRAGLKNACAVASMLLTTDTVIGYERYKEQGDALVEISKAIREFRTE